ncbi:NADH dehydrogenase [ubiquinone] 1 alpha subcomplex assembly factor 4-like [Macrosteles quadrilineatus]|uniref:NADH dehydrogenase [ubiquinone] 1 alpha subcomplex assembly factor 4-like n=1 Tax=Macrosteles quadrilineatus TaxID=74068 RepID=UPI0023E2D45A|nr:NADH dehydrogenase [ubiquinone] 1 alpha subcomplex assembly factor 4-like [Macrosteles quadrilineatus]
MGQAITKLTSLTLRELRSFNVEKRAEKVISREKPTPAPMYPSTIKELEQLKEDNVSTEYLHKKDERLDGYLKKVYVSSPDPAPPLERKIDPKRPLPIIRTTDNEITYGYSASEEALVPEGKVTLKQALAFISSHQDDPKKYSQAAIASQYKIALADSNDILEHFKMFTVRVQKKEVDPESLSAYERLQLKVKNMTPLSSASLLKEMKAVYGDLNEKSPVVSKDEKDIQSKNIVQIEMKTPKTIEDFKIEGNTKAEEKENKNEVGKKRSSRKHSQENG